MERGSKLVERKIVELKITPLEASAYAPPPGISITWLEWKPAKGTAVAEFSAFDSDYQVTQSRSKKSLNARQAILAELNDRLAKKVVNNNLGSYHNSPKRIGRKEILLNHPVYEQKRRSLSREFKRALDSVTDVHEVQVTEDTLEAMNAEVKRVDKSLHPIKPKEKRDVIVPMMEAGKIKQRVDKSVYILEFGEIESG